MLKKNTIIKSAFNEYKIIEQCGQGGNCTVFKVYDNNGKELALKVMPKDKNKDKVARFQNEIDFCYKNKHENIVRVLDFGNYIDSTEKELVFCIMPYYQQTLRDRIKSGITSEDCLEIFCNILHGLQFAHQQGVYHRDIKPENILLLENDNTAIISDFGIAHFRENELIADVKTTKTDKLANANYAAPEQRIRGGKVDGRSDIFALSLVLNEMFTKQLPIGANYQKIGNQDNRFDYLDVLFEGMNAQDPKDRLYPVDNILLELSVLIKKKNNDLQIKRLRDMEIRVQMEEQKFPIPNLVDAKYQNETLILIIKPNVSSEWARIFTGGLYSHQSLMGIGPDKFKIRSSGENQFFVAKCRENDIEKVVKYFKEWLPIVTENYNDQLIRRREQKKREMEDERLNEIKKKEKENETNIFLKSLI